MPSRPASSALIAIRNPTPSSPTSRSAATRASSNAICAIGDDRRPIVRSRAQRVDAGRGRVGEQARDAGRAGAAGAAEDVVEVGDAGVRDPRLGAVDARSRRRRGRPWWCRAAASEPPCGSDRQYAPSSSPPSMPAAARRAARRCRTWPPGSRTACARDTASATASQRLASTSSTCTYTSYGWRGAAVLLRVRQAEQSGPAERTDHLARELAARLEVVDPRRELAVGEVGREVRAGRRRPRWAGCVRSVTGVTRVRRGSVLSRRTPSGVHTTMSSIRAPWRPAR